MPEATIASAVSRTVCSFTLQANLFQLFQPIGGVRARPVGALFTPDIIFSPVEKGLTYLRTDMGGAYRWDEKRQRWIPLEDALAEGNYFGIESLAPDPRDPNTVYLAAGTYFRGPAAMLRSADRG